MKQKPQLIFQHTSFQIPWTIFRASAGSGLYCPTHNFALLASAIGISPQTQFGSRAFVLPVPRSVMLFPHIFLCSPLCLFLPLSLSHSSLKSVFKYSLFREGFSQLPSKSASLSLYPLPYFIYGIYHCESIFVH